MASYVVVRGTLQGVGNEDIYAVVIDDGDETVVLGKTDVADDLRDQIELADGDTAEERLASLLTGMSYFGLHGPVPFDGTTDSAVGPLSALYGLA